MTKDQQKLMQKMAKMITDHDDKINYLMREDKRGKDGIKQLKKALGVSPDTKPKEVSRKVLEDLFHVPLTPIPGNIEVNNIYAKMKVKFIVTDIPEQEQNELLKGIEQHLAEMCYTYGIKHLTLELKRDIKSN